MSFPGFFSLSSAWLFGLLIPLVVFYFLKLKRPRMEIPSLALWQQVINDQRVNSPFQKFKRNLLLLLQILLLILLVLAAMQPFIHSGAERAKYLPVLIDCSASMAALDKPGGVSRLEVAKQRVGQLIDNMLPDQRLSLITVHSSARRLTEFTNNKRVLHEALEKITIAEVPSKLEDALRLTQALARTVPIQFVAIYSDGNFPAKVDFELPFELNYQQLPPAGRNIGITALNARRSGASQWDVFLRVECAHSGPTATTIELLRDGTSQAKETLELQAGESQRIVFSLETDKASAIEVRLKPDGFDALQHDNVAYLDLPLTRPLTVYAHPELASYRHALQAMEGLVLFPEDHDIDGSNTASSYDLVISDRQEDLALDARVRLFVGMVPDDLKKLVSVETGLAEVVDWQRNARLLQHVQFADVQISDQPKSAEGVGDGDFEQLGYEILAYGRTGPLLFKKRTQGKLSYYLLFHTDRSTLPYRIGFPVLVTNAVAIALHEAALSEVRAQSTRVLTVRLLKPQSDYRITAPDGSKQNVKSDSEGVVSGILAPKVGQYIVSDASDEIARVGASLLDASETSLLGVEEIQFREVPVSASITRIKKDRPLWPTFALIAFGFLLIEWWYFQRRPSGVPA